MDLKLGKLPAKEDSRTLRLSTILIPEKIPAIPGVYDADVQLEVSDNHMYLNNQLGDCVIASRAHQTLRFEKFEQGYVIEILDAEVREEYFAETGGADSGLVMLDSLKKWRNAGWTAAGKTYTIHAFASVNYKDHTEVQQAIYLFNGVQFGMLLPKYAYDLFKAGERVWDIETDIDDPTILGGHAIYSMGYLPIVSLSAIGPVCVTWGERVQMTWRFWDLFVDECYACIDSRDEWLGDDSPVNIPLLEQYLHEVTGWAPGDEDKPGCHPLSRVSRWLKKRFK